MWENLMRNWVVKLMKYFSYIISVEGHEEEFVHMFVGKYILLWMWEWLWSVFKAMMQFKNDFLRIILSSSGFDTFI